MAYDKSTFERLLPALQHLAKFPSANKTVICQRHSVSEGDVISYINESAGSIALWDEVALAADAEDHGVKVGEYQPPKPAFIALKTDDDISPSAWSPKPRVTRPLPAVLAAPAPAVTSDPDPDLPMKNKDMNPMIAAVCRILASDADISEAAACLKAGANQSSWAYWKKKEFGLGPVPRTKLKNLAVHTPAALPQEEAPTAVTKRRGGGRKAKVAASAPLALLAGGPSSAEDPERVINLLVAAGFVSADKVRQAREFARAG